MSGTNEIAQTFVAAEAAFGHLRRNGLAAYPRNYELWYTYSAGTNRPLNLVIDDILGARGRVTDGEALQICATFFAPGVISHRLEEVGDKAAREIATLARQVNSARKATTEYQGSLEDAAVELASEMDRTGLQRMVAVLAHATVDRRGIRTPFSG